MTSCFASLIIGGAFFCLDFMMKTFFYGLTSIHEAKAIARKVTSALGGSEAVYNQMIEISCAETHCGTFPDRHNEKLGVGVCQHDQINIDDIQQEGEKRHFDIVRKVFGYDIPSIELKDLAYDPLLSFICCRLSLKRIPEAIPDDLIGRAKYWKEHYNTAAGDGTVEHYLKCVSDCLGEEWS